MKKFIFYLSLVLFLFPGYSVARELKPKLYMGIDESTGNTESIGVKLEGELLYEQESSSQVLTGGLRYAETEEVKSANSSYIEFKNTNDLTDELLYLYQSTKLEGDEFIGYNYRVAFNGGIGLKYKVTTDEIKAEIGPGFIYEDTDDEDKGFPSARSFVKYTYRYNKRLSGSSHIEHTRNLDEVNDHRTNWVTQAKFQVTEGFGIITSRKFSYVHLPPKGSKKHDWNTNFALVWTF